MQQKLAEADTATEQRLTAMKDSLQTAVAASSGQQAEHAMLQKEVAALREQLAGAQSHAADGDQMRSRDLEHQTALQVFFGAAIPAEHAQMSTAMQAFAVSWFCTMRTCTNSS